MQAVSHLPEPRFEDEPAPVDESDLLQCPPLEARTIALDLPLGTRFALRDDLTPVQYAFLQLHGFILFARVARTDEVATILAEVDRIQQKLLDEDITHVHGVPVWFGTDDAGQPWLQRMGFTSVHSAWLERFCMDGRFEPVRRLIGEDARIGTREKDGVVFNRYVNRPGSLRPKLGWHTDALRDVFYNLKMPGPMLNVGLHFDRITPEDGGLRLIPGSHNQSAWQTLFRKLHFISNDDDPAEVMVETWPGDLTVHDGRMWHRVKASPFTGDRSIRHSMYVPYVVDAYQPKGKDAPTNMYMRLFDGLMKLKGWWGQRKWRQSQASRRTQR
jgi:hypothetical protein